MRAIKRINDYKNRLLLSTALTAAVLFSDALPAVAAECESGDNGTHCTISPGHDLRVDSITANNINDPYSQVGILRIMASATSNLTGEVYLDSLYADNARRGKLNITGNTTVNTISVAQNINGRDTEIPYYRRGDLNITGTGTSTFGSTSGSFKFYLNSLNAENATLNLVGNSILFVNSITAKDINSENTRGGILLVSGLENASLTGNIWLGRLGSEGYDSNKTLNITGTTTAVNVDLKNVNSSDHQTGTLNIIGSGDNNLGGNVYLSELNLENNGTVIFSGTNSAVNTITLNDGTLVINNGKLYVSSVSSGTAKIYGTGILQLNNGWIDSTDGNKLAGLTVGSGTVNLSYDGNDVNIGAVTYASADKGKLLVKGGGGEVSIDRYTAQSEKNKLKVENEGILNIKNADAYDINVEEGGTLNVAENGTLNVENITAHNINSATSQYGTINVSGSGTFNAPVYLSRLNILNGANATFGNNFEMNGALFFGESEGVVIGERKYIHELGGLFSNGITDSKTYVLSGGTWTSTDNNAADIPDETYSSPGKKALPDGIFQNQAGGILISQEDPLNPPTIDFQGGVIWDYSAYVPSLSDTDWVRINGETLTKDAVRGDIAISGGILTGKIDIRKGSSEAYFWTKDKEGNSKQYEILSSGNINISGGQLNFTKNNSQIMMYDNNTGDINISGGKWNVSGNTLVQGSKGNEVNIIGGQFDIKENKTLTLAGTSGALSNAMSTFSIQGLGTLNLEFTSSFSINSAINWTEGTLQQTDGTLNINAPVTLNTFKQDGSNLSLVITGVLSITNDITMNGNLSGSGELKLSEEAEATIGTLTKFGTISVGRGSVTFLVGNDTDELSLSVLNGASGSIGEEIGTININSRLVVDTVNLGNSTLNLKEELVVKTLNFDNGKVVFLTNLKPLTLTDSTTIWNTSKIITDPEIVEDATTGMVTIKDGMTLTFADKAGTNDAFSSSGLTVNVENGAFAEFSSANVSFDTLSMTKGTATVKSGLLTVNDVIFGDRTASAGSLTVNAGAEMKVTEKLTATVGSTITADGVLSVQSLKTNGSKDEWATLTGAGTIKVTQEGNFSGRIQNLANLEINGGTATFKNQTGSEDSIGTMQVINGTVNLQNGTLTLDSLILDHGTVNLVNEDVTLALKQNPGEDDGISGEGNSISGKGTLELLNDTSMSFGGGTQGNVGYLGGLKIGTGTATITADTPLGSVKFSSTQGGTLQINSGATLSLQDDPSSSPGSSTPVCTREDNCRITTNAGNIVRGEGTLKLVNGDGSVFGGQVSLGTLDFGAANGTITFNYAGESQINNFIVNSGGANVIVNNGTLAVGNSFGNENTTVSGTGMLFLQNGTFKNGSNQSLANLKIGSGTVTVAGANLGNVLFNSAADGTLNLSGDTTVTGNITVDSGNSIKGTELILSGTGASGSFDSDLKNLANLTIQNGATAYINTSTQVGNGGNGLTLSDNSQLVIGDGAILTVSGNLGSDASSVITGDGTLNLSGTVAVKGVLDNLNHLLVSGGAATTENASNISGSITVEDGATLNFNGGSAGQAIVNGTLNITAATTLPTVTFDQTGGALGINEGVILTVTNNITVKANDVLSGTGTLYLGGNSSGIFAMNTAFDGRIRIGTGTAYIQTNAQIGAIDFANGNGGVLDIADGKTLTVGSIITEGTNKITGNGTLNLNGNGSSFKAPIDNLGTLKVSGGTADFYNNINIGTLAFNNGGWVRLNTGMTMNVTDMTQNGTIGYVYGNGSFVAGTGNIAFSTGNKELASATIGTGVLDFVGNSYVESLKYSSVNGTINISSGITVTVGSDFSGIGKLTGAETARLQLEGQAGATFENAQGFQGTISAGTGSLRFLSDTDFTSLILNSATAAFERQAVIDNVLIADGRAEFNQTANINSLTISSVGSVRFNSTAELGALFVGSGSAQFKKNATLTNGSVGTGGVLDIDVNTLTFNTGDFAFNDNSNFVMRISREATDEQGNVNSTGYGKLVFNGGTLNIRNNVKLDLTIDYGLQTAEAGSVFQLVDGNVTGSQKFVFENNRYSLTEETCSGGSGICYRLVQTSTGGQVAEEEAGNQNQINTAEAFLDGELFEYGTKIFDVAEHLDALSQKKGGSRAYLNALTAVAPDVTGAMTRQPIALQSKISNTLSARLNGLMGSMGSSSRTYREIQKMYGRSGGSPYRSRFMRSDDYYRRAGYYDQDDQPVTRPRPAYRRRVEPGSPEAVEMTSERKRWAKRKTTYSQPRNFGLWAQAFYNTADYLSTNKPDGFSGDTNGFAFGADMQLFDVFAVGLGYASTTTTLDTLQRSTDVTGDSFFLYGMYKPSDWFVSTVLNTTSMSYEESKDLSGMTVSDKYDGSSFGASVMFGKDLKTWTPAVGLRYVTADRDAHKDEIGQDISGISTNVMTLVAEGRFNRDFAQTNDSLWHSEFSGALTYDLTASGEDAVVNLPNGSMYTVKGDDFDPLGIELGASIAYLWGEHVDVSAGYNLEWRPDYMSHTLTAVFRYSF